MRVAGAATAPLSERLCDAACLLFALWTLCCHAVVAAGGTLPQLIALYAVVLGLLLAWTLRAGLTWFQPALKAAGGEPGEPSSPRPLRLLQIGAAAAGGTAVLSYAWRQDVVLLWWHTVALLAVAAAVFLVSERPRISTPVGGRRHELLLFSLALACAVITLVCHRWDVDDAFYVNLAVSAADLPGWPLLSTDTLHGIEGMPIHLAIYRVHSYEVWNGALSYLTGIPAIYCFHWLSAALGALLVPLAYAKLFRLLTPRKWLWGMAVLIFVLLATGETHRWHGNFSFVRMWQGKSVFLSIFMPLVYAYGLRFALRPTRRGWLLLAAAQIAAVGSSSSALWVAPLGAAMALASGLRPTRGGLRTFTLGSLASGYVLVVGWMMKRAMQGGAAASGAAKSVAASASRALEPLGEGLDQALEDVLGNAHLRLFAVAAILVAWAVSGRGLARRLALVFPLASFLVVLNPYIDRWVMANLTGPFYWRALWALPVPVLMALVLMVPLHLEQRRWRWVGRTACLLLLAAYGVLVPSYSGLSSENESSGSSLADPALRLGYPKLKVDPIAYRLAAALNQAVPAGSYVVAPHAVNMWIPTFHGHAYPLKVRRYLKLENDSLRERREMIGYVAGGGSKRAPAVFREGLDRYSVQGVCLRDSERADEARAILIAAGFRRTARELEDYEIWVRSTAKPVKNPP